jgi:hypothetical protein
MMIDWAALLPVNGDATPSMADVPAPAANAGGVIDREAWEERAAILEFDGGLDRQAAEAQATAETHSRASETAEAQATAETHSRASETAEAQATAETHSRASETAADNRRRCSECQHHHMGRWCAIAQPGGLVSAARGYEPVLGIPRRCEGFMPLPDDPDQRPGMERWPGLLPQSKQAAPPKLESANE